MTENSMLRPPLSTQDERVLAALSHVAIILPGMGTLAPILIWVTQRERSRFVAFQSLQAVVFQLSLLLLWFLTGACYMGSFFVVMFGSIAIAGTQGDSGTAAAGLMFFLPFAIFFLMLLMGLVMFVYGIVAAVLTFQGKDFRYALIGRWIERYQQNSAASTSS